MAGFEANISPPGIETPGYSYKAAYGVLCKGD